MIVPTASATYLWISGSSEMIDATSPASGLRYQRATATGPRSVCKMCQERSEASLSPMCTMHCSNPVLANKATPPQPEESRRSSRETNENLCKSMLGIARSQGRRVSLRHTKVGNPNSSITPTNSALCETNPHKFNKKKENCSTLTTLGSVGERWD